MGFPVFVKAVSGGGGRGMRRVEEKAALPDALAEAMREAESAFGDSRMYLEQAVPRPRHIEVQVLADATGEVIHLYERDCSVQRRHQKVVEIAPAPNLDPALRQRICDDAVTFARHINYLNAGTVEFLLGEDGRYVFIEMNPRIQVEHTVTEEVTNIDLVSRRSGSPAVKRWRNWGSPRTRCRCGALPSSAGSPPRTRPTGSGPTPESSRSTGRRRCGYPARRRRGVRRRHRWGAFRLDAGEGDLPGFRSAQCCQAGLRALTEFRVRGVSTNIPFLEAVTRDPDFLAGRTYDVLH